MNTDDIARALHADANMVGVQDLKQATLAGHRLRRRRPDRRFMWLAVAVVVTAVVAAGGVALIGRTTGADNAGPVFHDDEPVLAGEGACDIGTSAQSLSSVSTVADGVILGTVTAVRPKSEAPVSEAGGPRNPSRFMARRLTVSVDRALSGPSMAGTLEIEEAGWTRRDTSSQDWYPMSINGWPRLAVGDRALLPIQRMDDSRFSFLCSGPLLIRDGKIVNTGSDDSVNIEAYGLTIAQFAAKLRPSTP